MVMWCNLPKEALDDPFKPPEDACTVQCIHCGREYSSTEITWRVSPDGGFWCCPVEGCDGVGFGFDIFPADQSFLSQEDEDLDEEYEEDLDGEDLDEEDDEDDEEFEDDLEEEFDEDEEYDDDYEEAEDEGDKW